MSIVEEALNRLQEKKKEDENGTTSSVSGDNGMPDSGIIPSFEDYSQKRSWKRTWLFLAAGLFVLVVLSGGLFMYLQGFQQDSPVFIAQPQPEPRPLEESGSTGGMDHVAGEQVINEAVVQGEPVVKSTSDTLVAGDKEGAQEFITTVNTTQTMPVVVSENEHISTGTEYQKDHLSIDVSSSGSPIEEKTGVQEDEAPGDIQQPVYAESAVLVVANEAMEPSTLDQGSNHVEDPPLIEQSSATSPPAAQSMAAPVEQDPPDPFLYVKKMIARGDFEEAIVQVASLVEFNPEDWETWFWLGTAHLGLNQLAEATRPYMGSTCNCGPATGETSSRLAITL